MVFSCWQAGKSVDLDGRSIFHNTDPHEGKRTRPTYYLLTRRLRLVLDLDLDLTHIQVDALDHYDVVLVYQKLLMLLLLPERMLMPNTHRRRRLDATVELSRVGVCGVYWAKGVTACGLALSK